MSPDPPPPTPSVPAAKPPRPWQRYVKKLGIAFAFAAIVDLTAHVLDLQRMVRGLDVLNRSVEYGLESVNATVFASDTRARLKDRYHYRVWSLAAPFNLSVACRSGVAADIEALRPLCATRSLSVSDMAKSGIPPSVIPFVVPSVRTGDVDDTAYPRRVWLESVLGLPDGVKYAFQCGWKGRVACAPVKETPTVPTNWFGKTMLVMIVLFSFAAAAPEGQSDWSLGRFIVTFAVGLVVATVVAFVMLMIVQLLARIGRGVLSLSSVVVSLGAFPPLMWGLHALKDVVAETAKGALGKVTPPKDA